MTLTEFQMFDLPSYCKRCPNFVKLARWKKLGKDGIYLYCRIQHCANLRRDMMMEDVSVWTSGERRVLGKLCFRKKLTLGRGSRFGKN